MRYEILHRTHYSYLSPARESFNDVRLEPPSIPEQTVESYSLHIEPKTKVDRYTDFYSTLVHHFEIPAEHSSLLIESKVRVETHWPEPLPEDAKLCPMENLGDAIFAERCFDFLQSSQFVELDVDIWKFAIDTLGEETDAWQAALKLMRFTFEYLTYLPNSTNVHTHVRDVVANRCGVCQDFAHFMIGLCRSMKIPARYVSGYLATEIASATHAWIEVYIPKVGWRALDPTHNRQVGETYVKIGHGRDYGDVPPVSGHYHGTLERTMSVGVKITMVNDDRNDASEGEESKMNQKQEQKMGKPEQDEATA